MDDTVSKLPNALYAIKDAPKKEDATITYAIELTAQHPLYLGHFPGQPITPGVIWCEIVKDLIEKHLGKKVLMVAMRQCKFLSSHDPLTTPIVHIAITRLDGQDIAISATGGAGSEVYFKLSASYRSVTLASLESDA